MSANSPARFRGNGSLFEQREEAILRHDSSTGKFAGKNNILLPACNIFRNREIMRLET
jgi:hypothetical protein